MVAVSAPVDWLPLVALLPLQPPEAVQLVALVELHVNVAVLPLATVAGLAASEIDGNAGGAETATVKVRLTLPPAPEHVSVKFIAALSAPVASLPLVAFEPLQPPDAVQLIAFVELQVKVDALPIATVDGLAASVSVGAGVDPTATDAVWLAVPPWPVQVNV